ncbi:MAG: cytochrome ubiquinol oxidase subunit I, partial [Dokdonella sp.]
ETEPAPASFTIAGIVDSKNMRTDYAIKVPWMMGLIATRSLDKEIPGLRELIDGHEEKIHNGMRAYGALQSVRANPEDAAAQATLKKYQDDLGYGLLVKRYAPNVVDATDAQIKQAARDGIPPVGVVFWSFRIMVACGFLMLGIFIWAFIASARRRVGNGRWLLRASLFAMPLPWIACETGWIVAEVGRQPWTVAEVLPTWMSVSSLTVMDLVFSLTGFIVFYTALLIVEVWLMLKFTRKGPDEEKEEATPAHVTTKSARPAEGLQA